jgi:hypothetical protein
MTSEELVLIYMRLNQISVDEVLEALKQIVVKRRQAEISHEQMADAAESFEWEPHL